MNKTFKNQTRSGCREDVDVISGSQTTCSGKSFGASSALQKDSGGGTTTSSVLTKVAFAESASSFLSEVFN